MGIPRLNKETSLFRANAIPEYVAGVVTEAKAAIKVTTDQIALEVSRKVGASEVISRINQSPESVTIDADRLDIATSTDGGNGVFIHPRNDATTGWRISNALELLKGGVSAFRVWLDSSVTKVRVGLETAGHVVFSPDGMEVFSDASTSVAEFGASGARIGKANDSHITLSNNEFDVCDPSGRSLFNMELPEPGQDGLYAMAGSARLPGTSGPVTLAVPIPPITEMVGFYKSDGTLVEVPTIVNAEAGTYQVSSAITAGMYMTYYKTTTPPFIASIGTRVSGSTNGAGSIVLGLECRAISRMSLATGFHTVSSYNEQVAMGRYNVFDSDGSYALIIGNGTSDSNRSNALAVTWDGNIEIAGTVKGGLGEMLPSKRSDAGSATNLYQYAQIGGNSSQTFDMTSNMLTIFARRGTAWGIWIVTVWDSPLLAAGNGTNITVTFNSTTKVATVSNGNSGAIVVTAFS